MQHSGNSSTLARVASRQLGQPAPLRSAPHRKRRPFPRLPPPTFPPPSASSSWQQHQPPRTSHLAAAGDGTPGGYGSTIASGTAAGVPSRPPPPSPADGNQATQLPEGSSPSQPDLIGSDLVCIPFSEREALSRELPVSCLLACLASRVGWLDRGRLWYHGAVAVDPSGFLFEPNNVEFSGSTAILRSLKNFLLTMVSMVISLRLANSTAAALLLLSSAI